MPSTNAVSRCASQSFQLAGDGSSSSARTIRKLRAASLVYVEEFTTMFHRIFDIVTTRRDDARRGHGVCRRHDAPFRGGEAIGADEDILSASRANRRHFVENVIFLKHLGILLARCSNHVAPHGIASLCAIRRDVEKVRLSLAHAVPFQTLSIESITRPVPRSLTDNVYSRNAVRSSRYSSREPSGLTSKPPSAWNFLSRASSF